MGIHLAMAKKIHALTRFCREATRNVSSIAPLYCETPNQRGAASRLLCAMTKKICSTTQFQGEMTRKFSSNAQLYCEMPHQRGAQAVL
jgi:hypothetical protein